MTTYLAPTRDMQFVIKALAGLDQISTLPAFAGAELNGELVEAVLEEAGKLAAEVIAPLNKIGDEQGSRLQDGGVVTPEGFVDAYSQYIEGGWNGLAAAEEYGGQGLPELIGTAVHEIWQAANMSFALCPMLTAGAIEALKHHGSDELRAAYLPKMVSGEWTGTMNLTEAAAGSDLSAVRTRAVPEGDHYRIHGQKIFISWGDHDMAGNIVHLVLARTPDAPQGIKGISLFLVPQFLLDENGEPGQRNDVHCVSLEHKLGIHASPTCVLAFGDGEGAIGYLVGELGKGLACMFTMMNEARLKVGLQGLAIADRAYQQARDFAKDRVQGRVHGQRDGERVAIIAHPDVRRMLLSMKSQVEAMRGFCYAVAADMDLAHHHPDEATRRAHQARVDLLTPVVKGWCTEVGIDVASLGVQVHGGMGYVEETGACQYLRDARITTIYEGTTGIQANDLVGRKLQMDRGEAMVALLAEMRSTAGKLEATSDEALSVIHRPFSAAVQALEEATHWVLETYPQDPNAVLSGAVDYLLLSGYVCGGWQMARAALVAHAALVAGEDVDFHAARLNTARFYAGRILPRAGALLEAIRSGGTAVMEPGEGQF